MLGAVATFTDISRLHELQEERDDLVSALSHDLRSPLTAVLGYAQILQRRLEKAGVQGQWVEMARSISIGAGRMDGMVLQITEATRLEAGQVPISPQPVALAAFMADLLGRMEGVLATDRIRLAVPGDMPPVRADPTHLERICLNLLSNALKYSPPSAEVVVAAERRNGLVMVTVADQGPGIPPEDLPRLFARYFRAKGTQKKEGLGLGLYISRILVEAHGGKIWAESEVGSGSTFYFTLPVFRE